MLYYAIRSGDRNRYSIESDEAETFSMKIPFACPSCNATGSADAAFIGRQVRCKHCGERFAIPDPDDPNADVYALEGAAEEPAQDDATGQAQSTFFVPSRSDGTPGATRRPGRSDPRRADADSRRKEKPAFPWLTLLAWSAIVLVVALALIALLVPQGTLIAGCVLMGIGSVMILVGFSAGAYGAFCEDFIYGCPLSRDPALHCVLHGHPLGRPLGLAYLFDGGCGLDPHRNRGRPLGRSGCRGMRYAHGKPESPGSGLSGSVSSMRLSHTVRMPLRIMYASRCRCSAVSRA